MKKELLVYTLLILLTFPAVRALLIPGAFTSHDLIHHVVRQISMDKLLSEGQFPPRWSGELNNGYGYPAFLFNYPLPAMVGEVFHFLGLGYVDSVKAVLFSSMIMSVLGMYLFLKALLGSKLSAFLGSLFYLYAPLRFLNVYVSASVGSALALGILPFIFWSLVEIKTGKKWALFVGSLSFALLILSHNVTALIFAPVLLVFAFFIGERKEFKKILIMFLLGLGLSAWFWIPALFEKQYTRFDLIFGNFYKDQFVSIWQLLRSPWGYGLSHPQNSEPGDMSYQIGLIHILVMLMLISMVWVMREVREIRMIGGFALAFFAISVFLMLKISLPFWDGLPLLALVQFPLRFSAIAIFSASIAAALFVKYLPFKRLLVISLLFLVLYANRNHWHINQVFDPGEDYYLALQTTSTTYGEHLPKWGRVMEKATPAKLEVIGGVGEIRVIRDKSNYVLAEVEATTSVKLRFNQFYFLGWEIKVDGQKAGFNYLADGESYGLPVFNIDFGKHQVLAEFKNTADRNLADFISLVSVILWMGLICKLLMPNLFPVKRSS